MDINRWIGWLRARLTIAQYLSLRLLVGLALCILCLRLFAELVEEVFTEQAFGRFDLALANELHAVAFPGTTRFFELITLLGFQAIWVIGGGVGLYFVWKRKWLRLGVWVAALVGGEILDLLLKTWFARPRPQFADPLAVALYYSFPSGHATMSLITYGLLAYFLFIGLRHAYLRVPTVAGLILLILFIGFSRLYLGVHYASDVLAGFAVGGLWLTFCITAMNLLLDIRERRSRLSDKAETLPDQR
jgi:undecaprenyl-diphosphatase